MTRDDAERLVARKLDRVYGRERGGNHIMAREIVGALMDAWSLVSVPADAPVESG